MYAICNPNTVKFSPKWEAFLEEISIVLKGATGINDLVEQVGTILEIVTEHAIDAIEDVEDGIVDSGKKLRDLSLVELHQLKLEYLKLVTPNVSYKIQPNANKAAAGGREEVDGEVVERRFAFYLTLVLRLCLFLRSDFFCSINSDMV